MRLPSVPVRAVQTVVVLLALVIAGVACGDSSDTDTDLVIGSAPGAAPRVAAQIYAEVLRHNGAAVASDVVTASYPRLLAGFDSGRVDLFPAFTGTLLAELAPNATDTGSDAVYSALNSALPQGVSVGDPTPVSDQLQVVVAASLASSRDIDELSECSRLPAGLPVVGDRAPDPGTLAALGGVGCRFGPFRQVSSVSEVVSAVTGGNAVGLVSTLSTAGTDANLQALADAAQPSSGRPLAPAAPADAAEQPAIRAENLVPVFSTAALTRDQIKAINKVAGELTTADLATMAERVSGDPGSVGTVVDNWLGEHSL
ncbi:glycine betaine ABC transporter substrate-binding protein [Williamsia maris]|uniref:glycine betaine ABC transporter substrate-binding protein n=1 Tax=Williamsia maris TaxID=72806 RepID=UPI0020A363B8|nr:glycine betaine ABC transporter substrate-binding protein [Williamsia maris]